MPRETLRRYLEREEIGILPSLGRKTELGEATECVLVNHVKTLFLYGFSVTKTQLRSLAYELDEKMQIKQRFNQEEKMAGWDWIWGFLKRTQT